MIKQCQLQVLTIMACNSKDLFLARVEFFRHEKLCTRYDTKRPESIPSRVFKGPFQPLKHATTKQPTIQKQCKEK